MSGPLCDAVLEESGSAAMLESLARSNLFLVPLDRTREWYRYHHLFQELLRSELERVEPDLVPRLLARAADWCEANGQPETAIGYAQEAGDVDRVAWLVERCGPRVYQSGRVATAERWLSWLEAHGALEQNAAVAVLGALLAAVWGRPAEAERWADAAERGSYEGTLPDGSASIDSWLALLRAQLCRRGVARMRADAELAVGTLARGSQFWPHALLLLAISRWLAGEVDEADDLFAEVVEEGLELGADGPVAVALGERAAIAIGTRSVGPGGRARGPGAADHPPLTRWRSTRPARSPIAVAARVALHRGDDPARAGAARRGRSACGRGSPTRCRTSRSRPAWSSPGPT